MNIRNFCIIAHIDHGKSTLADRMLELTGTVSDRQMRSQFMDKMELEQERGITIKAKAVRMGYKGKDGKDYVLNLIDTPGHVDFTYEVSRALAACEGAILVVDASQGVEAQTLANVHLARQVGLKILPVLNKVDLASADVDAATEQLVDIVKVDDEPLPISAKTGKGVPEVLEAVVKEFSNAEQDEKSPLEALIFDSLYDAYRGVILFIRVVKGALKPGMKVKMFSMGGEYQVNEVGVLSPAMTAVKKLGAGEVGYLVTGLKDPSEIRVGDTVTTVAHGCAEPLPGYKEARPVVFAGIFPTSAADYPQLAAALDKLALEDSSFVSQQDSSEALGFGFRLGFLGLLHMEIIKERLEREFDLDLIATSPNVVYDVMLKDGTIVVVDNPAKYPHYGDVEAVDEPFVKVTIVIPVAYLDPVMRLLKDRRGEYKHMEYVAGNRVILDAEMPLGEMIFDFYDKLKSVSKGYASLDYEPIGNRSSELVKLDILIHGEKVDALSMICAKEKSQARGRALCEKLRELIPRQMFEIAIQAAVNGKIMARETVRAMRKDVTAKCYGGDITRKRKLLAKQKEGKKRMKQVGAVEIPQSAFLAVLKIDT